MKIVNLQWGHVYMCICEYDVYACIQRSMCIVQLYGAYEIEICAPAPLATQAKLCQAHTERDEAMRAESAQGQARCLPGL